MSEQTAVPPRFLVALSFPGEKRDFVRAVAERLGAELGNDRVFYDEWYEAELARANLDVYLQDIYGEQSALVVPFFCEDYEPKPWCCKVEWAAIRAALTFGKRGDDYLMAMRFDHAPIKGFLKIHGYIDIRDRSPEQIADLILHRVSQARIPDTSSTGLEERPRDPNAPYAPLPEKTRSPDALHLLHYKNEWIDCLGREEEISRLNRFLSGRGRFTWWALLGPGGAGKSRLALEWLRRVDADNEDFADWDVHFFTMTIPMDWFTENRWKNWRPTRPTAIAIDYAADRSRHVLALIRHLSWNLPSVPIRLLVIDRFGSLGPWFLPGRMREDSAPGVENQLTAHYYHEPAELRGETLPGIRPPAILSHQRFEDFVEATALRIEGFGSTGKMRRVLEQTFHRHREGTPGFSPRTLPGDDSTFWKDLRRITDGGRPLFLQIAALILCQQPELSPLNEITVRNAMVSEWLHIEIEQKWSQLLRNYPDSLDPLVRIIAFITLCRGVSSRTFFTSPPSIVTDGSEVPKPLRQATQQILPVQEGTVPPLQPDLLGLMLLVCSGNPNDEDGGDLFHLGNWLDAAFQTNPRGLGTVLRLLADDFDLDSIEGIAGWLLTYLKMAVPRFGADDPDLCGGVLLALCRLIEDSAVDAYALENIRSRLNSALLTDKRVREESEEGEEALLTLADILFYRAFDSRNPDLKAAARDFDLAMDYYRFHYGANHPEIAEKHLIIGDWYESIPRYKPAIDHYRKALRIREEHYGLESQELLHVLGRLCDSCRKDDQLREAEAIADRGLGLNAKHHPGTNAETGEWLWKKSIVLIEEHRFAEAELIARQSLATFERSLGEDHPSVGSALSNLAQVLRTVNRVFEAEPLLRRALQICVSHFSDDHPNIANVLNNLGILLCDMNRPSEAEPLLRRVLEIGGKAYGPCHPRFAIYISNLARLLQGTNRLSEAEPLLRRALEINEAALGSSHSTVAHNLNALGTFLQTTNRLSEAEPLLRRALAILANPGGNPLPNYSKALASLAKLLQSTNRVTEAEPLIRRALAIDEANLGPDHPIVGIRLSNLAVLLWDKNDLFEAEPLMRRALKIAETAFGPDHSNIVTHVHNLARLLQETNRVSEAEPLMLRALAIDEATLGADHPNVADRLNNLVGVLYESNRLAEAEPLMWRALKINRGAFGSDHPKVAESLNNLAGLLKATGRLSEAEPMYRRALEIGEASFGPDHPDVAIRLNNLAQLLQATNRLSEAEPLMRRHLEIFLKFTRDVGRAHPHLNAGVKNYANLLRDIGRSEEEIRKELDALLAQYGVDLGSAE